MSDLLPAHLTWLRAAGRSARTIAARRRVLIHADEHLPWGLDEADDGELATYLAHTGWSAWTRHTYHVHLSGYYRWAARAGHLTLDPMLMLPRPPEGPRIPNPLTNHELRHALGAPDQPWRRALMLAAYAGLRCCEIVTVQRKDYNEGRLRVVGKGGKVRIVPVAAPLARELATAPPGLLCVGVRGKALTAQMLTQMQRPVWRRMGLPDEFRLHRGRHWFATRLLEGGADIRIVQQLLGHASLHSVQGYTAVVEPRMVSAVAVLPDVVEPEPAVIRLGPTTEAA